MSSSKSDSYIDLQNSKTAATKDTLDSLSQVETDKVETDTEVSTYHEVYTHDHHNHFEQCTNERMTGDQVHQPLLNEFWFVCKSCSAVHEENMLIDPPKILQTQP